MTRYEYLMNKAETLQGAASRCQDAVMREVWLHKASELKGMARALSVLQGEEAAK